MLEGQPLDVSCIDLDQLRAQHEAGGLITLSTARPLTRARSAVLESVAPGSEVVTRSPGLVDVLNVPMTRDSFAVDLIRQAQEESKLSPCWWRKVGCVLADPATQTVVAKTHNGPIGEGQFCRGLDLPVEDVLALLDKDSGERLEFCHAQHAENAMISEIRRRHLPLEEMVVGLTVDPCDHCAHLLLDAKAVYLEFNPKTQYYSQLGIRILQAVQVPTYFVQMPKDE